MKKTTLYEIADAILNQREWLEINTASSEAVQDYAENGMDVSITTVQAEKILKAIKNWLAYDGPELQHNRYMLLEKPLSTHGGPRPGAGRKPSIEKRKPRVWRLNQKEFEIVSRFIKSMKEEK